MQHQVHFALDVSQFLKKETGILVANVLFHCLESTARQLERSKRKGGEQCQGGSTASRGLEIDQVEPTRCKKGRRRRTHVQQPPSGQEIVHLGFGAKVAQAFGVSYADAAVYSPFRKLANLGVVTNTHTQTL